MVIGFKESMKLFLDYDLLVSVWPQKRNWFKGADTVSLLAFLEDNLTKEIPGLKDDQIWKYCFFSQMRKPSLPRRTYAVQPTAKVTFCLEGITCLRSTHLRGQLNKMVTLLEEYVHAAGLYKFEPFTPGSSLYILRGPSCPFVGTTLQIGCLLHRQSLSFC